MYIAIVAAVNVVRVSLNLLPKLLSRYTAFTFNSYFFYLYRCLETICTLQCPDEEVCTRHWRS